MALPSLPHKFVAIDTETTGLNVWRGHRMFAAAASFPNGRTLYWRDEPLTMLKEICEDPTIDKVFQNAKFDVRMLEYAGIEVKGQLWDTMILAHLIDAWQLLNLDALTKRYLPPSRYKLVDDLNNWFDEHKISKKDRGCSFNILPSDMLKARCLGDATSTLMLFMKLYPFCKATFPFLLKQEHDLIRVIKRMEDRGITLNPTAVHEQLEEYGEMVDDVTEFCCSAIGEEFFNINSRTNIETLLRQAGILQYVKERTPPSKTYPKGQYKLDDWNLRSLHHPVASMVLVGRAAAKMRGTFLIGMINRAVDNIIHCNFKQTGTVTGRFSCSGPNLQNIPIEGARRTALSDEESAEAFAHTGIEYAPHIKQTFVCRPGFAHVHSDKSKAEIFALAHYAQDPTLTAIMLSGKDVHSEVCVRIFGRETKGLRTRTKICIFGNFYGAGEALSAKKMGVTLEEAREVRAGLNAIVPGLPRWKNEMNRTLSNVGYLTTIHGRRHFLPRGSWYMSVNRMCQGTVGDEIKGRMIALDDYFQSEHPDCQMLLNIHDDLGSEVPIHLLPEVVPNIHRIMQETDVDLSVPMPASCELSYTNWADLKTVKIVNNQYILPPPPETA